MTAIRELLERMDDVEGAVETLEIRLGRVERKAESNRHRIAADEPLDVGSESVASVLLRDALAPPLALILAMLSGIALTGVDFVQTADAGPGVRIGAEPIGWPFVIAVLLLVAAVMSLSYAIGGQR